MTLEQKQYKKDSIQLKTIPILKLPHFSPQGIGGEKARQFSKLELFLTERSYFYIVLALSLASAEGVHVLLLHLMLLYDNHQLVQST